MNSNEFRLTSIPDFQDYRAPKNHGECVFEPPFSSVNSVLFENQTLLSRFDHEWKELRHQARNELISLAIRHTSQYRDVQWVPNNDTIVMAGHQPTLFHPGVWFKNFALHRIGQQLNAIPINLIVDNDLSTASAIRVPTWEPGTEHARFQRVQFDSAGGGIPYEQRKILSPDRFGSFDERLTDVLDGMIDHPSVDSLWKHVRSAMRHSDNMGQVIAQGRHALESDLGLQTLEVHLSELCRTQAFAQFLQLCLERLPEFVAIYNEATHIYRRAHGIRSTSHPVPDLRRQDDWWEAPLWIYSDESPERSILWVWLGNEQIELSDRDRTTIKLRRGTKGAGELAEHLCGRAKIRPRALVTTMYARLVLSDVFLHGIGGAKYDQLGDMITRAFFGHQPPSFLAVSATVQLPNTPQHDRTGQINALRRQLRDTHFQPERFSIPDMDSKLIHRKQELLEQIPPRGQRRRWHHEITRINRELAGSLTHVRHNIQKQIHSETLGQSSDSLLRNREHPFCIYPLEYLHETMLQILET